MLNKGPDRRFLLALYFLSGFSALIYEVLWARMLGLVLGTTMAAWATVLSAYMGGIALGSVFGGRWADRSAHPLRLFALCEAGIGAFGAASLMLIPALQQVFSAIGPLFGDSEALRTALRIAIAATALVPPAMLMGATFPIVSRSILAHNRPFGHDLGIIYFVNTLGAVAGTIAAGFVLVPVLGVSLSLCAAAGINLLVSAALLLSSSNRRDERPARLAGETADTAAPPFSAPSWLFPLILGCSGFCAMAFELLWGRTLVFFLTSTTYAFTVMLSVVLSGLAIGGMAAATINRGKANPLAWIAGLQLCIGFLGFISPFLLQYVDPFIRFAETPIRHSWSQWLAARYAVSFFMVFPVALCMGIELPLCMGAAVRSLSAAGRSVGKLLFVNTACGIAGSLCAAFLLVPAVGTQRSFAVCAALASAAGLIALVNARRGLVRLAGVLAVAMTALFVLSFVFSGACPMVLYSQAALVAGRPVSVLSYREDEAASVSVLKTDRERTLNIDGFNAAGTYRYEYMHLMGHLPVLLSQSPDTALVICLGTGTTCGAVGLHPSVKRVDCIEISQAVIADAAFFDDVNNNVIGNPKIHILHDDGRNHLLGSPRTYNVITLEPMHPYLASATNLYSYDFYNLCRKRLAPHGIMAQWAPLHMLSSREYRTLISTFVAVFPHTSIWFLGTEGVLVGTLDPLRIDVEAIERKMADRGVRADLEKISLSDPKRLLSCFLMDERAVAAYVKDVPVMTDDRPLIEFSAPRNLVAATDGLWLVNMNDLEQRRVPVPAFTARADSASKAALDRFTEGASLYMKSQMSMARQDCFRALHEIDSALTLLPGDTTARMVRGEAADKAMAQCLNTARTLRRLGNLAAAEGAYLQALGVDSTDAALQTEVATLYNTLGMVDKGLLHAEKAVAISPDDPAMLVNLAVVYMNLNRPADAKPLLRHAIGIRENDERAQYFLTMLEKQNENTKQREKLR
jgi:spermidine synthase